MEGDENKELIAEGGTEKYSKYEHLTHGADFDFTCVEGLSDQQVEELHKKEEYNELQKHEKKSVLFIILGVLTEPMFLLLVGCAVLYFVLGDPGEAAMLLFFVLFIMGLTIYQEKKTEKAVEALRDLSSPRAVVIRNGKQVTVPGKEVVRGDVVVLKEGDRVPADIVLVWASSLTADESLLTGESVPVRKVDGPEDIEIGPPGGDDLSYCFSGSVLVSGRGVGIVKKIGGETELGKIGKALESVKEEKTPIEGETNRLVLIMGIIAAFCALGLFLFYGITKNDSSDKKKSWIDGALMGLAVAMGLLPEEFPVVLAIFISLGAWRISKHNVLARKNKTIETLGSCSVLCTDKTGTLTQNVMTVNTVWFPKFSDQNTGQEKKASGTFTLNNTTLPEEFHQVIEYGILASQRDPFDPMETALKKLADENLIDSSHDHPDWELVREYPLSRELLSISRVWKSPEGTDYIIAAKGAPEAIADLCHLGEREMKELKRKVTKLAARGLRLLGVARATFSQNAELPEIQHDYEFKFIGIVGYMDPIRPEIPRAVEDCYRAGIHIIMITGDYPVTAKNIGKAIGLRNYNHIITGPELKEMSEDELSEKIMDTSIFARVVPEQKLQIVSALKKKNQIVAMTGDGVNDAPALKAAHIGISMGERGTDVAREASGLVLLDDNFASITKAVKLGRRIFDNLCKAMRYIIAIHVPLAGLAVIPILAGLDEILYPTHIVFLELIIDPACSVVLESEKEEPDVMDRPPRDINKHMVDFESTLLSFCQGITILCAGFISHWIASQYFDRSIENANALCFTVLIIGNVALIITNRSKVLWIGAILRRKNLPMNILVVVAIPALLVVLFVPGLNGLFHFSNNGSSPYFVDFVIGVAIGLVCLTWCEVYKFIRYGYKTATTLPHKKPLESKEVVMERFRKELEEAGKETGMEVDAEEA